MALQINQWEGLISTLQTWLDNPPVQGFPETSNIPVTICLFAIVIAMEAMGPFSSRIYDEIYRVELNGDFPVRYVK